MGFGNIFEKIRLGENPRIVGGPYQPPVQPTQPQAQAGLPLIIQQLYGGLPFTPGADTMEAGFKTSPGFRPGSPMNINLPSTFAPGYGGSINNPGFRTADFRDSDGDGIDDRDQIGPGQPRVQSPGFSFGNTFGLGPMAQTTLADLSAFNPIANQYALAGFTVGEILAMPEFADFAQSQAEQTGGTATSAGLANLEAQLRDRGSPEDRFGYKEPQKTEISFDPKTNKFVYDRFAPNIDQTKLFGGVKVGDEVPFMSPFAAAVGLAGTGIDKFGNFLSDLNPFKEERKRIARAQALEAAQEAAKQKKINDEIAKKEAEEAAKQAEIAKQQNIADAVAQALGGSGAVKTKSGVLTNQGKPVSFGYNPNVQNENYQKQMKQKALAEQLANIAAATKRREEREGGKGNPGAGGGGGLGCFVKGTMVEMADGTEKEITSITVGEKTKGGVVEAKLEFMPTQIYNYKDVEVSGSHLVMENNQFVKVEDSEISVVTDKVEPVYCFETSDNRIWVKGIEFGDYLTGSHDQWQPHIDSMLETINQELNGHI